MATNHPTTDAGRPALTLGQFREATRELPDDALIRPVHRDPVTLADQEFLAYRAESRNDPATGREDVVLICDYPPFAD